MRLLLFVKLAKIIIRNLLCVYVLGFFYSSLSETSLNCLLFSLKANNNPDCVTLRLIKDLPLYYYFINLYFSILITLFTIWLLGVCREFGCDRKCLNLILVFLNMSNQKIINIYNNLPVNET